MIFVEDVLKSPKCLETSGREEFRKWFRVGTDDDTNVGTETGVGRSVKPEIFRNYRLSKDGSNRDRIKVTKLYVKEEVWS